METSRLVINGRSYPSSRTYYARRSHWLPGNDARELRLKMASIPPDCDLEPPKKRFRLCKVSFPPYKLLALHTGTPLHFTQQQKSTKIAQSFTCTVDGCNRSYTCADTLRLHMKQAHNKHMTQKRSRFVCPMSECAKCFFHATQLTKHMKEHKVDVGRLQKQKMVIYNSIFIQSVTDNLEFPDWSSFLQWKEREETETFTCYTKPNENKDEAI